MSGYTPVFDSVFKGSLYGKWPDTAAWVCMLALADWRGQIDIMPEAIAGMTGMPLPELLACIERFCQPDPRSRSQAEEGRKLVLIDPARDWGWQVVNIQLYRDRASDQNQIADGRNAEKVKRYKERHRGTPPDTGGHRQTPLDTPDTDSDSDSDSDSDKNKKDLPSGDLSSKRSTADAVEDVFNHWKQTHGHQKAQLDLKRRRRITEALKHFSAADLRDAISGYRHSPHHMGTDPRGNGVKFDDIELFLRDTQHVETGLRLFAHPPRPPPKAENATERILRKLNATDDSRVIEHDPDTEPLALTRS